MDFLDSPLNYTHTPRVLQSPADYASALEITVRRPSSSSIAWKVFAALLAITTILGGIFTLLCTA